MGHVLGSDTDTMTFSDDGIGHQPAGRSHAVDLSAAQNSQSGVLAYALCGTAVRVWPDQAFDPEASGAHEECVVRVGAAGHGAPELAG